VDVHGLGGECRWSGNASPLQRAAIAWGGVWGQLAMFVVALVVSWLVAGAMGSFGADLFYALTFGSLFLAALNLLPFPPLDGAEAWKLPRLLAERWRRRRAIADQRAPMPRARIEPRFVPGSSVPGSSVPGSSVPGSRPEPRSQAERLGRTPARSAENDPSDLRNILLGVARDAREARKPRS